MRYFFGQGGSPSGPAPGGVGTVHGQHQHHNTHTQTHTQSHTHSHSQSQSQTAETSSVTEVAVTSVASSQTLQRVDASNVAFEMKSLEKHIEAVKCFERSGKGYALIDVLQNPSEAGPLTLSPREEMETTLVRSFIASYFAIVRQMIQDLVPKAIMHFMVNHTAEHVQARLVSELYKPERFSELLHEDEGIVSERARVKALLEAYREAFKTLSEINLKT